MFDRKAEILEAAVSYVAEHGITDLSLRPMAKAIGTSARLLIFHFKSKEALVEDVLGSMQLSLQTALEAVSTSTASQDSNETTMKRFWLWASHSSNLPFIRTLYEVHFIAARNPAHYGKYLSRTSSTWLSMIAERLPPSIRNKTTATLVAAVFDGLLLETSVSKNRRQTGRAMDLFIDMLVIRAQSDHGTGGTETALTKPTRAVSREKP